MAQTGTTRYTRDHAFLQHAEICDVRGIEVPIVPWPRSPERLLRISARLYNSDADYHRLAAALVTVLAEAG